MRSCFRPRKHRISIHAPAWGATGVCKNFNQTLQFQSTLPHGERPEYEFDIVLDIAHFNPRSRMGSDPEPTPAVRTR